MADPGELDESGRPLRPPIMWVELQASTLRLPVVRIKNADTEATAVVAVVIVVD
jgi:hypothetical protein